MKRKLIFLNFILLVGSAFAAWKLREQYLADQVKTDKLRRTYIKPQAAVALAPTPKPDPFTALPYVDVAQKDLCSRKTAIRTVVIEAPPPKPVKIMPPLPQVAGVMGLPSGMMALMSEKPEARPHGVRVNEIVGDFKVVAITPQEISFEWDGQRIDRKVEELLARAPTPPPGAGGQAVTGIPLPPAPAKPTDIVIRNRCKSLCSGRYFPRRHHRRWLQKNQ